MLDVVAVGAVVIAAVCQRQVETVGGGGTGRKGHDRFEPKIVDGTGAVGPDKFFELAADGSHVERAPGLD